MVYFLCMLSILYDTNHSFFSGVTMRGLILLVFYLSGVKARQQKGKLIDILERQFAGDKSLFNSFLSDAASKTIAWEAAKKSRDEAANAQADEANGINIILFLKYFFVLNCFAFRRFCI